MARIRTKKYQRNAFISHVVSVKSLTGKKHRIYALHVMGVEGDLFRFDLQCIYSHSKSLNYNILRIKASNYITL